MATARAPRARRAARGEPGPVDWGEYAAAVHRWELITGRPAPYPTQPGRHGRPVLAPPFVEWLMGLPQAGSPPNISTFPAPHNSGRWATESCPSKPRTHYASCWTT